MRTELLLVMLLVLVSACKNKQVVQNDATATEEVVPDYRKLGDSLSTQAQMALLSNVSDAMGKGGPVYAVDFCHENAGFITETLSKAAGASIQRISLKTRNPENAPADEQDVEILNYYAALKEQGQPLRDTVVSGQLKTLYYKPIVLAIPACLKCHGTPDKDIDAKTFALLQRKYPQDKATGYQMGDIRGAWKISFEK